MTLLLESPGRCVMPYKVVQSSVDLILKNKD